MKSQIEKAEHFLKMHETPDILVLPNAFDAISARILAAEGFPALATTSGGCAFSLGYCDGENITRQEMIEVVGRISRAVDVPVSADMEAGFGVAPEKVAETVEMTIAAGAVGINIEDSEKGGKRALLDHQLSIERIQAARHAIDHSGVPIVLNARTDAFTVGSEDPITEAINRANAYFNSGADCVFVIGVSNSDVIGRLASEINGPLNILAGAQSPTIPELAELGVKRVTFGSGFAKVALTVVKESAKQLRESGSFSWLKGVLGQPDIHGLLGRN
jgi:2-methylisocitrate lyase-like PEP mutase family enzyme